MTIEGFEVAFGEGEANAYASRADTEDDKRGDK
jgi:hypothetical protein